MEDGIAAIIASSADAGLKAFGTNDVVRSLAVDGVLTGVGSVLTFLPIIVVLFLFPFHSGRLGLHGARGLCHG